MEVKVNDCRGTNGCSSREKKVKELEEKLANRYLVGVDVADGKPIFKDKDEDTCIDTQCNCEKESCDCKKTTNAGTLTYEEFIDVITSLLCSPESNTLFFPYGVNRKAFLETLENVKQLEEYIKKKNDLLRRVSNKYTEIYNKFMQNTLTQKDFKLESETKPSTDSVANASKKPTDEDLIAKMKENMSTAYKVMKKVGDKKPAEHTPVGRVDDKPTNTVRFNLRKDYKPFKDEYMVDEENKTPETGIEHFDDIVSKMREIYIAKNSDYGSSFDKGMNRFGWKSFLTRVYDKFNRVDELTSTGNNPKVVDEKLEDTLMDLANYAILGIIYLRMNNNPNL